MEDLKHSIALQRSVHWAEVEGFCAAQKLKFEHLRSAHSTELELKDSFCEAEKIYVLAKLQIDYKIKPPRLYDEQYELGY